MESLKQKHLLNLTMIPLTFEQWFKSKLKQKENENPVDPY